MNTKVLVFFFGVLLLIGGALLVKGSMLQPVSSTKLQVSASFYPMYFFASQVGGSKAEVYTITPASVEPHDYEPTTQDIARISQSKMLVLNGGALEPWGEKMKDELQGSGVRIVIAGEGLAKGTVTEGGKNIQDPHVWLNPILAKKEVEVIVQGYVAIDPKDASYFKANAQKLEKKLDQLNASYIQGLSSCQRKDFVTSHAAFGYLAEQYGLHQIAISGVSPDEEPSSQKLAEIANIVKKENIKIIFFESLASPKLSQTIAQETGAQTMVLDPIEGISQNNLNSGKNYFTVMRDNLSALQTALQCNK